MKRGDDPTTLVEYSTPRSPVTDDLRTAVARAAALHPTIKGAFLVSAAYPPEGDSRAEQLELHFELDNPPGDGGAPVELFRSVARDLRSREGVFFTFTTRRKLGRVRDVGSLVWSRDGK